MDAAAWLAEFARRGQIWRDERQALWDRLGAERESAGISRIGAAHPVVLVPGREIEPDEVEIPAPASAWRMQRSALACGWTVRVVGSVAAIPGQGIARVVTVRARRHDERLWAAWRGGSFDEAWYVGPSGLERLGMLRLSAKRARRGVLDVLEGVRGSAQWVDLLERQEMDRAVGLISTAWPGLQLTRQ